MSPFPDLEQFNPNLDILFPQLLAPLPLEPNSRPVLQQVFKVALATLKTPFDLTEPASTTGGGLVHACQEFVLGCHEIIGSSGPEDRGASAVSAKGVKRLLWACRDFLGALNSAYVLQQATEGVDQHSRSGPEEEFERLKDFMKPLETRCEELGLPRSMDPGRLGILQVHLDEMYDFTGRLLQQFYRSVPRGGNEFGRFARALASGLSEKIVPDHLLASGAKSGRESTALVDLLPELEREFQS